MSARRAYRGIEFVALDRQFLSNRAAIPSELQDQRNELITGRKGSFEIGILSDGTKRSERSRGKRVAEASQT